MNDLKEETASTARPTSPALRLMETAAPPLRFGRPPVWKMAPVPVAAPLIPAWNWHACRDFPERAETVTLTENGPYLAALGAVTIAHGDLHHTGPMNFQAHDLAPGYYRITVPRWVFSGTIVSPLGDSARLETEDTLWVAAPTLALLLELELDGYVGGVRILDSYTAGQEVGFRTWEQSLRAQRSQLLDQAEAAHPDATAPAPDCDCPPCSRYRRSEASVSDALTGMLTGSDCGTHRPDWAHTVLAAHSADMWRKAWRYLGTNRPLVSLAHLDELQVLRDDLQAALDLALQPRGARPPFAFDLSGRTVGALRVLSTGHLEPPLSPVTTLATLQETEDSL